MPRVLVTETTLYKYGELSEDAKAKARDWWRELEAHDPQPWDYMYEDFERCAEILGISINKNPNRAYEPAIYWSGFSSQGDGACFEGSYAYAKGARHAIRNYAPLDEALHHIADELQKLQSRYFYSLSATVKHTGRYSHEYCTQIDVDVPEYVTAENYKDASEKIAELLRDFMRWMYRQLDKENDYRLSDEQVAENIEANEYEFTEDGRLA